MAINSLRCNMAISVESPLGRALLGKRAGDEVVVERPRGAIEHEIVKVRY